MPIIRSVALLVALVTVAVPAIGQQSPPPPSPPLRVLAQARGFFVGAAVSARPLEREPLYAQTLAREFNILTPENAMKFGPLRPARDRFNWRDADSLVSFAEANGMKIRGHTLVWHSQLPGWLSGGIQTKDELAAILREHISAVVGRYRGRIAAWDVVNEAVADGGGLRDTVFLRTLGAEYIDLAFRLAHEADPEVRLFYNDYGAEALGQKSDVVFGLVRDLKRRGVPVHGVGLQMHVTLESPPDPQGIAANIKRLGDLGLEIHITEMDVRIREPITEEKLGAQARVYRDIARACLSAPSCKALVLWGFTDRHSWIPGFFPGHGGGLIFDAAYQPKPAYTALAGVLAGR